MSAFPPFIDKVRSTGRAPLSVALVGHFDDASGYKAHLDGLVRRSGPDRNIKITRRVIDGKLFSWYRAASAYVSLSEHEGFGVPLELGTLFNRARIPTGSASNSLRGNASLGNSLV